MKLDLLQQESTNNSKNESVKSISWFKKLKAKKQNTETIPSNISLTKNSNTIKINEKRNFNINGLKWRMPFLKSSKQIENMSNDKLVSAKFKKMDDIFYTTGFGKLIELNKLNASKKLYYV